MAVLAHEPHALGIDPLAQRLERGVDHRAERHLGQAQILFARIAQEVRHRALDAVELFERDLRIADVLGRGRVLAHLLHEALRRGDRVADLVRDLRGEILERAHVPAFERAALARDARGDLALHLPLHLALDHAPAQVGRDERAEIMEGEADAPEDRHPGRRAAGRATNRSMHTIA